MNGCSDKINGDLEEEIYIQPLEGHVQVEGEHLV